MYALPKKLLIFAGLVLIVSVIAQSLKIEGVFTWGDARGELILSIIDNQASGQFSAAYSINPSPNPGGVSVGGEDWLIQGTLDGKYDPNSGDLKANLTGDWNYEGYPKGRSSPFPATNVAPFQGTLNAKLNNGVLSGRWSASVATASNPDPNIPQPPTTLAGTVGSRTASRLPQCPEGNLFYGSDVLQDYYTEQPSLTYERDALVRELVSALQRFRTEGGVAQSGVTTGDSLNIAQTLATTALSSGREGQLQQEARKLAQAGEKVSPADFFYISLKLNGGNVQQALLTAHAALYRDGAQKNRGFINEGILKPMRNPAGYSSKVLTRGSQQSSVREAVGSDEQGVWYHFFGMAALEFADSKSLTGIAPMFALRFGAQWVASGSFADKLQVLKTVPTSGLGGALSDFAIAMENAIRKDGSVPDPDKQCINFSGVAAGRALAEAFDLGRGQDEWRTDRKLEGPISGGTYQIRSPLSLEILGTQGEQIRFEQKTARFHANTPLAFIETYAEANQTTALLIVPLFRVSQVRFTGSANGMATIAYYHPELESTGVYQLEVRDGMVLDLQNWTTGPALFSGERLIPALGQERRLFSIGNVYAVANNPSTASRFRLEVTALVTRIVTYHWNQGQGKTPGTIALRDDRGNVFGPWVTSGSPGQGGVPDAYWTATPDIVLEAGNYTVLDSDPQTWAQNPQSNGQGFVDVFGIELHN